MLNRAVLVVIFVPLAIVLITLAVANRAPVPFTLNPFAPGDPTLTASLPFFVWLFLALGLGILIGSVSTWARQGRYRKLARDREKEASHLRGEIKRAAHVPPTVTAPGQPALPRTAG